MKIIAVILRKEVLSYSRNTYLLSAPLLYLFIIVLIMYNTIGLPDLKEWTALFWITQLFIIINTASQSFHREEKGLLSFYHFLFNPSHYFIAKLLYHVLSSLFFMIISWGLFILFLGDPHVHHALFLLIALIGTIGFSILFTFLSALAVNAENHYVLVAVLGCPIIIPQLMILNRLNQYLNHDSASLVPSTLTIHLLLLITMNALMGLLALLLFKYLWKE